MRLVGKFNNSKEAQDLSHYLTRLGIVNQLDVHTDTDWGSEKYGDAVSQLWVIDEDQVEMAFEKIDEYLNDPEAALKKLPKASKMQWLENDKITPQVNEKKEDTNLKVWAQTGLGPITKAILIACTLLLFLSGITTPHIKDIPENVPSNILLTPTVNKVLMYDYPQAYTLFDKIVKIYGLDSFRNMAEMPHEEQVLVNNYIQTGIWTGLYDKVLNYFSSGKPIEFNEPMFEKIREGQIWRALTPIFLHYDIFHLFFNMIWLLVLGKQLEDRLGPGRYILLIVLTGLFSNTLQYLMSGSNFLGFSGVLCGMITFVWMRQKKAAWEGYQMQSSTMSFITVFIIAMFAIQLISFFLEIYTKTALPIGIANTAHLSGAALGAILGRSDFFAYKNR
jgi:GlpG protein